MSVTGGKTRVQRSMAVDVPPNGGGSICNLALTLRRALAIFGWKSRLKANPHIKDTFT
jgi:hypothetical protein